MIMIKGMNPYIRQTARDLISKKGLNQTTLSETDKITVTLTNISKALNGTIGKVPKVWQEISDAIDAEMVLIPRDKLESIIRDVYGDATWHEIQADLARDLESVLKSKESNNN